MLTTIMFATGGCAMVLHEDVVAANDAPDPDKSYKEGARQFPLHVPTKPDAPASAAKRKAWETLVHIRKPFLTAFSDKDKITSAAVPILRKLMPGSEGQVHTTIKNGGYFLQGTRARSWRRWWWSLSVRPAESGGREVTRAEQVGGP